MTALAVLWIILKILIGIVVFLGVFWLILPYLFRIVVSPNFDGAYKYSKNDFEEDGKTPKETELSEQNNDYTFELDEDTKIYSIKFGDNRILEDGLVKVHYQGEWYSSKATGKEKNLLCRADVETTEPPEHCQSLDGTYKRIQVEWTLEQTSIRLITYFNLFKKCKFEIEDPDLTPNKVTVENLNFIMFETEFPDGLDECATGNYNKPLVKFPCFKNNSPNQRMFSYKNAIFSPPTRNGKPTNAPRIFFDEDYNTFLITALDEFIIHLNQSEDSIIECGLEGEIETIKSGYTSRYICMFDHGINNTFERMGDILRNYHNKTRKSMYMDIVTSTLGYWTDNGAYYYYNPIKDKKSSETLLEVEEHAKEFNVPFQYYDLDSWWYVKDVQEWKRKLLGNVGRILGGGLYGGTIRWEHDENEMHVDVGELSKLLDKPFIAHNRWYSSQTPHKDEFDFYIEKDKSICIEKDFWDMIMTNCEKWNIQVYEQDWMNNQINAFKILRTQTGNADKWLMNMGKAAEDHGRTIQYCMANPGMFLTSLKLDSVSHARSSGDYHPRWPKSYDYRFFAETSILSNALRIWPFKDVFRSTCEGPINGEKMPEFIALISTLSCGPVGPGDKIGSFGLDTFKQVCRNDGLIIKPDKSLTAADSVFNPNAKYFLATTYSQNSGYKWYYALVNKLLVSPAKDISINKKDIGIAEESMIAYDYFGEKVQVLNSKSPLLHELKGQEYKYWILAPFLTEYFGIIGDVSKFTTLGFKEFKDINVNKKTVKITIENIKDEPVQLLFYDNDNIESIIIDGKSIERKEIDSVEIETAKDSNVVEPVWEYSNSKKLSCLDFKFEKDGEKTITIKLN